MGKLLADSKVLDRARDAFYRVVRVSNGVASFRTQFALYRPHIIFGKCNATPIRFPGDVQHFIILWKGKRDQLERDVHWGSAYSLEEASFAALFVLWPFS